MACLAAAAMSIWLDQHDHLADVDLQLLGVVTFAGIRSEYRRWLQQHDCSPLTVRRYMERNHDFAVYLAHQQVRGIPKRWNQGTPKDLYRRLDQPAQSGPRAGLPLSAHYRAHYITAVCGLYRFAHQAGYLRKDPMALVRPPKIRDAAPRSLTRDELRQVLIAAEDDDRMLLMCSLGFFECLRAAEIAGAMVEDFYPTPPPGRLRVMGKGRKERWVPLHLEARHALDRHLAARAARPGEPLVDNRRYPGQPLRPASVSAILQRFIFEVVGHGSAHWLRHSGATAALEAAEGSNLEEIRELLGHATDRTTRGYVRAYQWNVRARAVDLIQDPREVHQ